MKSTLYQRRVEQEWKLLTLLASANESILKVQDRVREGVDSEVFGVTLSRTQGVIEEDGSRKIVDQHSVSFLFPPFFPSVPIEARLFRPVFHPNVHPGTGFVCLWNRFSSGDTVMEAVAQLQRVLAFELVNEVSDHVMQPAALDWYRDAGRGCRLPLRFEPLARPVDFEAQRAYAQRPAGNYRRRLQ